MHLYTDNPQELSKQTENQTYSQTDQREGYTVKRKKSIMDAVSETPADPISPPAPPTPITEDPFSPEDSENIEKMISIIEMMKTVAEQDLPSIIPTRQHPVKILSRNGFREFTIRAMADEDLKSWTAMRMSIMWRRIRYTRDLNNALLESGMNEVEDIPEKYLDEKIQAKSKEILEIQDFMVFRALEMAEVSDEETEQAEAIEINENNTEEERALIRKVAQFRKDCLFVARLEFHQKEKVLEIQDTLNAKELFQKVLEMDMTQKQKIHAEIQAIKKQREALIETTAKENASRAERRRLEKELKKSKIKK